MRLAPPLVFGCWAAGGLWWGDVVDDDAAVAAMRTAWDGGVRAFDTAPLYGHGHADALLRRAFGPRFPAELQILSKCGVRWDGAGHAESDLSAGHVRADVEATLRRLGVERVALMQVHWPCQRQTPLDETVATLRALQAEGKIAAWGVCNYNAEGLRALAACGAPATLQTAYSLLRREFEAELRAAVDASAPRPLVLAYEPLCRGLLAGAKRATTRYPDSDLRARDERFQGRRYLRALALVERLRLIARRAGEPVAALALGWALRQRGIDAVIVGARRPAQVAENLRALVVAEDAALVAAVDAVARSWTG